MTADTIEHLRGIRYRPPTPPLELARRALHVIANSGRADMGWAWTPGDPVACVRDIEPDAWRVFGAATITAAAAQMPNGGCRWCVACSLARVHSLPEPNVTQATQLLLGRPCHRHRRETTLTAAAGSKEGAAFGRQSYAPGTYVAVAKGGRLGLGKRVISGPPPMDGGKLDPGQHYVRVWGDGTVNVLHTSACALQPGACPLDTAMLMQAGVLDLPSIPESDSARQVSRAFVASAAANLAARVRGGPPTEVKPLTASARNLAAMKRLGINPSGYFGEGFTTQEDDAALGRFVRRMYPGRGRKQ
jgi:hypothetical protein